MTAEQIKLFLDEMRSDLGFRTDVQLAEYLDVHPLTIWRWRQGQIDTTKQKLVAYLWSRTQQLDHAAT